MKYCEGVRDGGVRVRMKYYEGVRDGGVKYGCKD